MKTLNEFIKEAYENLCEKCKSYLTHLFSHSLDAKEWSGSRFNLTSVGLSSILNGYWPNTFGAISWTDVTEQFKGVLLPNSFCYQCHDIKGAQHLIGAKDIYDFDQDAILTIHKEEFKTKDGTTKIVYSVLADAKEDNCKTDVITVILQDDPDLGLVPAAMHPGDPLQANMLAEDAKFEDGEKITVFKARCVGFTTVKLSFK